MSHERVVVIGTSGSGKTTFAGQLAATLDVTHTELDALYWGPEWTPVPPEDFTSRVASAVSESHWVIDGNYAGARDLVWKRATTLVWLDYSFGIVFWRAVSRTFRRIYSKEPLFAGNTETLAVFDREWIPWWVLRTFWKGRRENPALLERPEYSHLKVSRLRRPADAERLLGACRAEGSAGSSW